MSKIPMPIKLFIGGIGYQTFKLYMKIHNLTPHVENANNTIKYIKNSNSSIARFGDGELLWIFQSRQPGNFEKNSPELAKALKKVLINPQPNLILCIPDIFDNLNSETQKSKTYWEGLLIRHGRQIVKLLDNKQKYYDSRFTRIYMDSKNKKIDFESKFNSIKSIWNNRNVLIVEGNKSRFGMGNDLLKNAKSVKRILCPSKNAFEKYDEILAETKKAVERIENVLVLLALGPTATVLAYDLSKSNIQAIDIGHLDIEYDWYKANAKTKISIPGKYVNESSTKYVDINSKKLEQYRQEIIKEIKE